LTQTNEIKSVPSSKAIEKRKLSVDELTESFQSVSIRKSKRRKMM
jgi:hypothetical protein